MPKLNFSALLTSLVVSNLLTAWVLLGYATCWLVLSWLVMWVLIAKGLYEKQLFKRACFARCYLQPKTWLTTWLQRRWWPLFISGVFAIIYSLASVFFIIELGAVAFIIFALNLLVLAGLFNFFTRLANQQVAPAAQAIFVKNASLLVASGLGVAALTGYLLISQPPSYLQPTFSATLAAANNSYVSNCVVVDALLSLKTSLNAATWFAMHQLSQLVSAKYLKLPLWLGFLLLNALALIGVNRLMLEVLHWVNSQLVSTKKLAAKNSATKGIGYYFDLTFTLLIVSFVSVLGVIFLAQTQQLPQHFSHQLAQPRPAIFSQQQLSRIETSLLFKHNLNKPAATQELLANLQAAQNQLDSFIHQEINQLFTTAKTVNLEKYLDFHYSVKGEYLELFYLAADKTNLSEDKLSQVINAQLLGENFNEHLAASLAAIEITASGLLNNHLNLMLDLASSDLDTSLNSQLLADFKTEVAAQVTSNLGLAKGTFLSGALAVKLSKKMATKLGSKLATKAGVKTTGKLASAGAAAGGGGLAGLACGPGAPVCSFVLGTGSALIAWFGADAVIISLDEKYNRQAFKQEILTLLEEAQTDLTTELNQLAANLEAAAKDYQQQLEATPVKRRVYENF